MTRSDAICSPQPSIFAEVYGSDPDSPLILHHEMIRHGVKGSEVGKMHDRIYESTLPLSTVAHGLALVMIVGDLELRGWQT